MTLQKTDVVGNRYGKLVVKEITQPKNQKSRCLVQCDCGNSIEVYIANLKKGNTTTCGCSHNDIANNNIDLVGQRFGKLVVEKRGISQHNRARWFCRCDCGGYTLATGKTLREGKKKSCGCIKREQSKELVKTLHESNTLAPGVGACNHLMSVYKWGAKKRGYEFDLNLAQFSSLTSRNCHYCGAAPAQKHKGVTCSTFYIYNGIDRVDSKLGYIIDNCVPCCGTCNKMKMTLTQNDFLKKCVEIANFQLSKITVRD